MFKVRYIALLVVALIVMACGDVGRSVEVHDVPQSRWYSAEEFYYENEDTLKMRDMSIVVRYGAGYVADSVALRILSVSPDSMVFEEPFTLHIPHLADMYPEEHTFVYRNNVVLRRKGDYIFRLTPDNPVEGIAAVGIVVSE